MRRFDFLMRLYRDARGTSAIEYGVILMLIAVAAIAAMSGLANQTSSMWNDVASQSSTAMTGS